MMKMRRTKLLKSSIRQRKAISQIRVTFQSEAGSALVTLSGAESERFVLKLILGEW